MHSIKSHLALIPLLLLSKSDLLRWAPILFFKYDMSTHAKSRHLRRGCLLL